MFLSSIDNWTLRKGTHLWCFESSDDINDRELKVIWLSRDIYDTEVEATAKARKLLEKKDYMMPNRKRNTIWRLIRAIGGR